MIIFLYLFILCLWSSFFIWMGWGQWFLFIYFGSILLRFNLVLPIILIKKKKKFIDQKNFWTGLGYFIFLIFSWWLIKRRTLHFLSLFILILFYFAMAKNLMIFNLKDFWSRSKNYKLLSPRFVFSFFLSSIFIFLTWFLFKYYPFLTKGFYLFSLTIVGMLIFSHLFRSVRKEMTIGGLDQESFISDVWQLSYWEGMMILITFSVWGHFMTRVHATENIFLWMSQIYYLFCIYYQRKFSWPILVGFILLTAVAFFEWFIFGIKALTV